MHNPPQGCVRHRQRDEPAGRLSGATATSASNGPTDSRITRIEEVLAATPKATPGRLHGAADRQPRRPVAPRHRAAAGRLVARSRRRPGARPAQGLGQRRDAPTAPPPPSTRSGSPSTWASTVADVATPEAARSWSAPARSTRCSPISRRPRPPPSRDAPAARQPGRRGRRAEARAWVPTWRPGPGAACTTPASRPAAAVLADRQLAAQMTIGPLQLPGSASTPARRHLPPARLQPDRRRLGAPGAWTSAPGTTRVAINTPGQSGDPFSPHYRDLFPLWAAGDYVPLL